MSDEILATQSDVNEETTSDPDLDLINVLSEEQETGSTEAHDDETLVEEKFRIKVNGVEQEVSKADALARLQKELAADQKFEEASKIRKEAEEAIQQKEKYTQSQTQLQQAIDHFKAQATALASEGLPTPEQMQQLLIDNPHEYLILQNKLQARNQQLQQVQAAQTYLQKQRDEEAQAVQAKYIETEKARLINEVMPEWKDEAVRTKEAGELKDYLQGQGYTEQDWQQLCYSRADNFKVLKKAMLYDRAMAKANAAKAKPVETTAQTIAPVTTLGKKTSAHTVKSIFDPNLSDEEYSRLRREQRRSS